MLGMRAAEVTESPTTDTHAALQRARAETTAGAARAEEQWRRRSWWLGLGRLVVFGLFSVAFVQSVRVSPAWVGRGMVPAAVVFAALVVVHARVRARQEGARRQRILATESLARLRGAEGPGAVSQVPARPCSALDAGRAGLGDAGVVHELDAWAAEDLGIDGERPSLFALLNTTQTSLGGRRLRVLLRTPLLETAAIRARQEAVEELAADAVQRDALMFAAFGGRTLRVERVPAFLARQAELPGGTVRLVLAVCGILVPLLLVLGWLHAPFLPVAGLAFIVLFAVSLPLRRRVGPLREAWLETEPVLRVTRDLGRVLAASTPRSAVLQAQRTAFGMALAPGACLPRSLRLVGFLHLRGIGFLYGIIELLTSWELHWLLALEAAWRRDGGALERIVGTASDLEALVALAVYRAEQRGLCVAEIVDAPQPVFEIEGGVHPLLADAVPNDLQLGGVARVAVITGSNMAGKSTYLRMVALNTVLAQIGAPVRATRLRCTPLRLVANINVHDSLADGKSYFLVEVERVQNILALAERSTHVLGIFDELFRGTNSSERLAASLEVARWLAARGGLFLLATHEQELARLAGSDGIVALHFGDEIRDDALVFPYRVREGVSTSHNALRWLERCGYPRELVEGAKQRARAADGTA